MELYFILVALFGRQQMGCVASMSQQLEFAFMADESQNCSWCKQSILSSKRIVDAYGQYCGVAHQDEAAFIRYAHGV